MQFQCCLSCFVYHQIYWRWFYGNTAHCIQVAWHRRSQRAELMNISSPPTQLFSCFLVVSQVEKKTFKNDCSLNLKWLSILLCPFGLFCRSTVIWNIELCNPVTQILWNSWQPLYIVWQNCLQNITQLVKLPLTTSSSVALQESDSGNATVPWGWRKQIGLFGEMKSERWKEKEKLVKFNDLFGEEGYKVKANSSVLH